MCPSPGRKALFSVVPASASGTSGDFLLKDEASPHKPAERAGVLGTHKDHRRCPGKRPKIYTRCCGCWVPKSLGGGALGDEDSWRVAHTGANATFKWLNLWRYYAATAVKMLWCGRELGSLFQPEPGRARSVGETLGIDIRSVSRCVLC